MGASLVVFVEIGYESQMLGNSADQTIEWSTVIRVQWFRHTELYRLMGWLSNSDSSTWMMYPLRGMPSDASDEAKEYIGGTASHWASWVTVQELFDLQEALTDSDQMPEFHATVAFVKEYKNRDPNQKMRIVYRFSP